MKFQKNKKYQTIINQLLKLKLLIHDFPLEISRTKVLGLKKIKNKNLSPLLFC